MNWFRNQDASDALFKVRMLEVDVEFLKRRYQELSEKHEALARHLNVHFTPSMPSVGSYQSWEIPK